jgi:hypothetical protein
MPQLTMIMKANCPKGKKDKMTPLDLLKNSLLRTLHVTPRDMDPSEIQQMEMDFLFGDTPIKKMIAFHLHVPQWSKESMVPDCTLQAWAWEREVSMVVLTKLPQGMQGKILAGKISFLNNRADIAGRYVDAEDGNVYHIFSQVIYSKHETEKSGNLAVFHAFRAAREAAKHMVLYSLGNAIEDLSRALYLVGAVCLRVGETGWPVGDEIEF